MKEFLEKKWWAGVGVIVAITLFVLGILERRDILHISGIAVSIALNIIFVIVLVVLIVWGIKWKRKYEAATRRIEEMQGAATEVMKGLEVLKKDIEAEKKAIERKMVLLPDETNISRLKIDNALLSELYGQACGRAVDKYHDAKLNGLSIVVHPYTPSGDKVAILFDFYSKWANRVCRFYISETEDMHELLPDHPAEESDKATFDELPWVKAQNWAQFLKKSCEKVGPLSPNPWTNYMLSADAHRKLQWWISFEDGVTGKRSNFDWDGIGEPIPW